MRTNEEKRTVDMPELLTQKEVIGILRLDQIGLKDPKETLRYLRRTGQIGYVKVAGKVLIPKSEVETYVEKNAKLTDCGED